MDVVPVDFGDTSNLQTRLGENETVVEADMRAYGLPIFGATVTINQADHDRAVPNTELRRSAHFDIQRAWRSPDAGLFGDQAGTRRQSKHESMYNYLCL
jgi:hypothetical protein